MNTLCKSITLCLAALLVAPLFANERHQTVSGQACSVEEQDAILDTIAQINHINWVVNAIKTYNNAVVLEEEYEKISPGNLNLNRIPDEETLERISKMLDTLHSLRKDERSMRHWRRAFNESRDRRLKTYKLKMSKQAFDSLAVQVKDCCSLWNWAMNPGGSLIAVAQTAWGMSHCSVSLYNDYENFVYELDKTADDKAFAFDTAKMDLLHQQNKELLQDQWRLMRRYHLNDQFRVTDVDIKMLLAALKDDAHLRIYNRLVPMADRFSLFPEYWYYLSCAALETGHFQKGVEACDSFFKVNRDIFRNDPMVGAVALNKAFMLEKTETNKPEIRRCLEIAWKSNILRGDWQISYLSAIMYYGIFNEKEKAEKMLDHAVALIESKISSHQQCDSQTEGALSEGLYNCRNALHQLRGEPLETTKWRRAAKTGDTMNIVLPGGVKMLMIYVAPGSFVMGSNNGGEDEKPAHMVNLTKGFWMGKYEVTQIQWKSVMGSINVSFNEGNPWWPVAPSFLGANRPMDNVSWDGCQDFIGRINAKLGEGVVRLPTEAEWEYACRAGTTGDYAGTGQLDDMGWYTGQLKGIGKLLFGGEDEDGTHDIGQKNANAWGFCDMHGNVCEWCNDYFGVYPYGEVTDPLGPASSDGGHVRRGGSWQWGAHGCTSSFRANGGPGFSGAKDFGFRLVYTNDLREK